MMCPKIIRRHVINKIKDLSLCIQQFKVLQRNLLKKYTPSEIDNIIYSASYHSYRDFLCYLNQQNGGKRTCSDFFKVKNAQITLDKRQIEVMQPLLVKLFGASLKSAPDQGEIEADNVFIWGAKLSKIDKLCVRAMQNGINAGFLEDGFIRSVVGGLLPNEKEAYRTSYCLMYDDLAPHYDGNHQSRLEYLILNSKGLSHTEQLRADKFIKLLHENYLTKYNNQQIFRNLSIGINKEKVLIVLQSYGDASVDITGGGDAIFKKIYSDALAENPQADILVKLHPDTLIKRNKSYLNNNSDGRVYFIDFDINPISLLDYVDKVYVYSSQMGLEALLLEKKVVVYGKPCYAGWGLTDDRAEIKRRNINVTLPQLVDAVYLKYSSYFDPQNGKQIRAEEAVGKLLAERAKYFNEKRSAKKVLIIKLDGIGDYVLFRNYVKMMKQSPYYAEAEFTLLGDIGYKECAEFLDSDFFSSFIWVNRRNNKLLSTIVSRLKKNQKKRCWGPLFRKLHSRYLQFLFKEVLSQEYDCIVTSAWNFQLEHYILDPVVKQIKSKTKIARAGYHHVEQSHKQIYNFLVPTIEPEFKTFRGHMEKQFFENIIGKDLHNISQRNSITLPDIQPEQSVVMFTGAYHPKRMWALQNYLELAKYIVQRHDLKVYVCGEIPACDKPDTWPSGVIDFTGRRPFNELLRKIAAARLIVTNDTGFYHIAVALDRKIVVLSNGNSYYSFLQYPNADDIQYVLAQDFKNLLSNDKKNALKNNIISSKCNINSIDYNEAVNAVDRLLPSGTPQNSDRCDSYTLPQGEYK